MVETLPMPATFLEELHRNWIQTDEPQIRENQKRLLRVFLKCEPEVRDEILEEGRDEGLAPLVHLFERRLHRPLDETEHDTLRTRLHTLGPNRLGDVVLDLTPDALAAWLADPAAT